MSAKLFFYGVTFIVLSFKLRQLAEAQLTDPSEGNPYSWWLQNLCKCTLFCIKYMMSLLVLYQFLYANAIDQVERTFWFIKYFDGWLFFWTINQNWNIIYQKSFMSWHWIQELEYKLFSSLTKALHAIYI